ncbi:MAG: NADH-quinone oxidoreductase subunit C [Actinobacteria bacterium]|nr:NADH-quinone oxidoreductase subunit C [Actinomycetota bacterium]
MRKLNLPEVVRRFDGARIEEIPFGRVLKVPRESFRALCEALKLDGCELSSITAVDRIESLEVDVHLLISPSEQLTVKTEVPVDDPKVDSLCPVWTGAEWQEREVYDMYGVEFSGHPDLTRILLTDDFEGFPLRKSYELEEVEW